MAVVVESQAAFCGKSKLHHSPKALRLLCKREHQDTECLGAGRGQRLSAEPKREN